MSYRKYEALPAGADLGEGSGDRMAGGTGSGKHFTADMAAMELDSIKLREGNSLGYGKTIAKSLGVPYAMISVSRSCGLLSDLEDVFGRDGMALLYHAVSKVFEDSCRGSQVPLQGGDMAAELLGYDGEGSVPPLLGLLREVGASKEKVFTFLGLREDHSDGVYFHDSSIIRTVWPDRYLVLLSDSSGVPISYRVMKGSAPGSSLDVNFDSLIGQSPGSSRLVVCSRDCSLAEYHKLMSMGLSFIIGTDEGMIHSIGTGLFDRDSGVQCMMEGRTFNVLSTIVGDGPVDIVDWTPIVWKLDPVVSDLADRTNVERRIYTIEHRLRSLAPEEAMRQFKSTAGRLSRFFDISLRDGRLDLSIRRKDLDDYIDPKPLYIVTSGFETWDEVMTGIVSARIFRSVTASMTNFASRVEDNMSEEESRGILLLDFISLIIMSQMAKALRASGTDLDVPTALSWLGSMMCIGSRSEWQVVGMTPRNRKVLSALGLAVPKRIVL